MYLAKMWHLMKAHRKRTKITKIIPTWPSPQLAPPAPAPAAGPVAPTGPVDAVAATDVISLPVDGPKKPEIIAPLKPLTPLAPSEKLTFEKQEQVPVKKSEAEIFSIGQTNSQTYGNMGHIY